MLISTDQALARLNNPDNLARRREINDPAIRKDARSILPEHPDDGALIRPLHNGGRRPGDKNLTDDMRALIGAESQLATLAETSEKFNISHHHAHELGSGKVSTAAGIDDELVTNINRKLSEPHQLAVDKLTETLLALDSNKIKAIGKAKDLASVAAQLSRIAETTSPLKHGDDDEDRGSARIIIYSPTIKQENHYASVETTLTRDSSPTNR